MTAWYGSVRVLVRTVVFGALGGMRTRGGENVPREGGLIVAPVHLSYVDPPAVACGLPRQLTFMAKEELFRGAFGWVIRSLGAFPVKRGDADTEAIKQALALLEEERALLVFPEGTRGDGVPLLPISRGVTLLARRSGAPVLPVAICGTHKILPKGGKGVRRSKIEIVCGPTFRYADFASEKDPKEAFSRHLRDELLRLQTEAGLPLRSGSGRPEPAESGSPE